MKAITPSEATAPTTTADFRVSTIVTLGYNRLIKSRWNKKTGSATFTQAALTGWLQSVGCWGVNDIPGMIKSNMIRPDPCFIDAGWVIADDPGFYDTYNGAKQITFTPKVCPIHFP